MRSQRFMPQSMYDLVNKGMDDNILTPDDAYRIAEIYMTACGRGSSERQYKVMGAKLRNYMQHYIRNSA